MFKKQRGVPGPAPENPGANLVVLYLLRGVQDTFFYRICEADPLTVFGLVSCTDLRSRSFKRLWASFLYRICEADPLRAFGLGIWTNLVLKNIVVYILVFKKSPYYHLICVLINPIVRFISMQCPGVSVGSRRYHAGLRILLVHGGTFFKLVGPLQK